MDEFDEFSLTAKNELHEYALITTTEGLQTLLKIDPGILPAIDAKFEDEGQGAFISIGHVETGEVFRFPGNIAVMRTFAQSRLEELKSEAKSDEQARASRVIVPNRTQ